MSKHLVYFLPAIIWGAVIFVIISMPPSAIPPTDKLRIPDIDKIIHFGIFFVLGLLLVFGFVNSGGQQGKHFVISVLIGIAYGALTEYLQYCCIMGRYGSFADFIADVFGTVFGALFIRITKKGAIAHRKF